MTRRIAIVMAMLCAAGCGKPAPPPSGAAAAPEGSSAVETDKSITATLVDGFTGKTAVEAGKKAKAQLEQVGKQEKKDLDDVMGQ